MADEGEDRRATGTLERHVQTILISVVTGAIVFSASYFFNDKSEKAVLTTQMAALNQQVSELRGEVRAMQANFATKDNLIDHEARIRALERKVLK